MLNKMSIEGGDNSTNTTVAGDVNISGITYLEARQIALDVFKANFFDLSTEAKQTADVRVEEITNKVIERLYSEVPDKVHKINDPDIQYSIFNVQKEYTRVGDAELGENLVIALIDKIKIDDRNSESFVIDDALQILTKLSKANLAFLGMIVFSKIGIPINSREEHKQILLKLSSILKDMILVSNLDMAYLKQSGCVYGTTNIEVNKPLEVRMKEEYEHMYSDLIAFDKFDQLISKHTNNDPVKQLSLIPIFDKKENQILGLIFSNKKRYNDAAANHPAIFREWVKSFCEEYFSLQPNITNKIILDFHMSLDKNWGKAFEIMKSQQVASFNLNPVGLYIGALYLGRTIDMKIPLDIFYTNN